MPSISAGPFEAPPVMSANAATELLSTYAPVIVGMLDTEERLTELGGALLSRQSKWPSFIGRRMTDLVDDEVIIRLVRDALAGRPGHGVTTINSRPWLVATRPVQDAEGGVSGCAAMITYANMRAMYSDLTASEALNEQLVALIELSRDFIAVSGEDGKLRYLNRSGRQLIGISETADVRGLVVKDLFAAKALSRSSEFNAQLFGEGAWHGNSALRHVETGESVPVIGDSYLVRRPADGELLGIATVHRDLRPMRDANRELRARVAASRAVADLGRLALSATAHELMQHAVRLVEELYPTLTAGLLQLNPAGTELEMVACSESAFLGSVADMTENSLTARAVESGAIVSVDDVLGDAAFPDDTLAERMGRRSFLCCPVANESGTWGVFGFSGDQPRRWTDDDRTFVTAMASTLGAAIRRQELEGQLQHQALHDPLTGLPNRVLLTDRLEHALGVAVRRGSTLALLLLDIDDFKVVNDDLGHGYGDRLLQQLSRRFQVAVRDGDTVARLGGDEFAVLCEDLTDEREADRLAAALMEACREELDLAGRQVSVTASIGVALARGGEGSTSSLFSQADIAMYRAKRECRGTHRVFDEEMRGHSLDRVSMSGQLRTALRESRVEAHYQPIVDVLTGRVIGLEALARWRRDDGQMVRPDVFIPVAEETGLITELGASMLRRSIRDAAGWTDLGDIGVRVNTTAQELRSRGFFEQVMSTLAETGYPARLLGLEITESMLVEDDRVTHDNLARLREAGVRLLVDDFGTGYSSLSYLNRFPVVDVLKVDRSFLSEGSRRGAVVEAVVGLGRAFGLEVCAEGVETPEQHALVAGLGCDLAQGYLFGRPMPADEVRGVLEGWVPQLPSAL